MKVTTTERIFVYAPKGTKAALLEIIARDGGTVSAYVLALIRSAIRDDRNFRVRKQAL